MKPMTDLEAAEFYEAAWRGKPAHDAIIALGNRIRALVGEKAEKPPVAGLDRAKVIFLLRSFGIGGHAAIERISAGEFDLPTQPSDGIGMPSEPPKETCPPIQVPACDECSVGVMDMTNPHRLGTCSCKCHKAPKPSRGDGVGR